MVASAEKEIFGKTQLAEGATITLFGLTKGNRCLAVKRNLQSLRKIIHTENPVLQDCGKLISTMKLFLEKLTCYEIYDIAELVNQITGNLKD